MDLSLPGRFLVHTPLGDSIHISKRLGKGPDVQALRQRLSATLPNQGGWHHVNEQEPGYWIQRIEARGMRLMQRETAHSHTLAHCYWPHTGLIFSKE
jgi:Ribonuclease G/E